MVPHRPDVCAALEELLADGWALGVVTNGAPDAQRTELEVAHLRRYFGSVVISGEIGVRKPDRALFQLALDELHADEDAWSVMVGDNPAGDIGGGHGAGLRTIWVRGSPWPEELAGAHLALDATSPHALAVAPLFRIIPGSRSWHAPARTSPHRLRVPWSRTGAGGCAGPTPAVVSSRCRG